VFVPLAFFSGSVGNIYRQFAVVMGASIAFSAFFALSLTPALCATLLKPVEAGHHHEKGGLFGRFNRGFARTAKGYEAWVARLLPRAGRTLLVYLAIVVAAGFVYLRLPTSLPRPCWNRSKVSCSSSPKSRAWWACWASVSPARGRTQRWPS